MLIHPACYLVPVCLFQGEASGKKFLLWIPFVKQWMLVSLRAGRKRSMASRGTFFS